MGHNNVFCSFGTEERLKFAEKVLLNLNGSYGTSPVRITTNRKRAGKKMSQLQVGPLNYISLFRAAAS